MLAVHVVFTDAIEQRVDEGLLVRAVEETVARAGSVENGEITLTITDDAHLRALNHEYRKVDEATDVLSFAFDQNESELEVMALPPGMPVQLGDVVLSYERAVEQAERLGHTADEELAWLTVHGVLQLFGYAHKTEADIRRMSDQERSILAAIDVTSIDVTAVRLRH